MEQLRLPMRSPLPWWALQLFGFAAFLVGIVLVLHPFQSLVLLSRLISAGLLLVGTLQIATAANAHRPLIAIVVGIGWLLAGLLSALWPGITMHALTVIVGLLLAMGGLVKVVFAVRHQQERLLLLLSGLAYLIFALLALTAPAATVLVLALLFGLYVGILGISYMMRAFTVRTADSETPPQSMQPWSARWRLTGTVLTLLLALAGLTVSLQLRRAQPAAPDAFYNAPDPLPAAAPGTIIRTEQIENEQTDADLYRVLYLSTSYDGQPTPVSGLVIIPTTPPPATGRPVIASTHGTVGVAPNCAPSLIPEAVYERPLPGLTEFLAAGYVIVATDYQGLGTAGPHPYLVGVSAAMNALDSVRAIQEFPEANATSEFVVWGESQGGHTALFTGQLAASYAPDLQLRGVVASAPAADLTELFKSKIAKPEAVGNLLVAMALNAWSQVYPEARLDDVVLPAAQNLVQTISRNCIQNALQIQRSIPAASLLNLLFFRGSPLSVAPWSQILVENTPGALRTDAPILIAQGESDQVIDPTVQASFAAQLCAAGDHVDYRTYPGVGHLTIAHETTEEVIQWIADRFAGVPVASTCATG